MQLHTVLFLIYIAAATAFAFADWRLGPFLIVLAAAVQDPIRKTTPGAPAWLVLGTALVFVGWAVGFVSRHPGWWAEFRLREPLLSRAIEIFAVGMVIPIVIDVQYGLGGVKLIILGLLFYGVGLANLVLGYYYGGEPGLVRRLFRFYCIVTCIMLVGVVLERHQVSWLALGTERSLGTKWIRYIPGRQIEMFSGFYRSPDIMGWHATIASLLALILATTARSMPAVSLWLGLSGWGLVGTFFCGRRKFFYMVPVFLLVLMWLHVRRSGAGMGRLLAMGAASVGLFYAVYQFGGVEYEDVAVYYYGTLGDTLERAQAHGLGAVMTTFRQSGLLGKGLGSAATGAHRAGTGDRPHTWQEGGFSRLAVELGLPGLLCALWLGYALFKRLYATGEELVDEVDTETDLYLGVFALIVANGASFVVSGQIFGAPFVGFFFSLLLGIALAGARAASSEQPEEVGPTPTGPASTRPYAPYGPPGADPPPGPY